MSTVLRGKTMFPKSAFSQFFQESFYLYFFSLHVIRNREIENNEIQKEGKAVIF